MASIISNFNAVWIIHEYKNIFRKKGKMIWFSREDVKKLLDQLDNNGYDGIRIYRGKYPMHDNFKNVNGSYDYRGEKTIVFMPTIRNGALHEDNIPEDEIKDIVRRIKSGDIPAELAFNHGELCPPNCIGDTVDSNT